MINVDLSFISGVMFGFELADDETCEEQDINWGFILDLGIIRILVTGVNN